MSENQASNGHVYQHFIQLIFNILDLVTIRLAMMILQILNSPKLWQRSAWQTRRYLIIKKGEVIVCQIKYLWELIVIKGTFQKRFRGFFPLRGYPPTVGEF